MPSPRVPSADSVLSIGFALRIFAVLLCTVANSSLIFYFAELSARTGCWAHVTSVGTDVLAIIGVVGLVSVGSSSYVLLDKKVPRLLAVSLVVITAVFVAAFAIVYSVGLLIGA